MNTCNESDKSDVMWWINRDDLKPKEKLSVEEMIKDQIKGKDEVM